MMLQDAFITIRVEETGKEGKIRRVRPPKTVEQVLAAMELHGEFRTPSNNRVLMKNETVAAGDYVLRVRSSKGSASSLRLL